MNSGRGGKRAGAGRKPNALKGFGFDALAEAWPLQKQVAFWKAKLASTDERISLDAGKYLTDRIYGKPKQEVSVEHGVNDSLAQRLKEARKNAARLRENRNQQV